MARFLNRLWSAHHALHSQETDGETYKGVDAYNERHTHRHRLGVGGGGGGGEERGPQPKRKEGKGSIWSPSSVRYALKRGTLQIIISHIKTVGLPGRTSTLTDKYCDSTSPCDEFTRET